MSKEPKISQFDRLRELELKVARFEGDLANHLREHRETGADLRWKLGLALTAAVALVSLLLKFL